MLRKEIVLEALRVYTQSIDLEMIRNGCNGVSASELSQTLQIDRANCSRELNQLFTDDVVIKVIGKPVLFFSVSQLEQLIHTKVKHFECTSLRELIEESVRELSGFDEIIGAHGSLKVAVDQAKAAMIYPPFGLHTLITGETGIGKTMLVDLMYNYAKEFGVLSNEAQLVTFNCAEYADNPQLLVSELFGYVKGAFTGADNARTGLVEKANGGILFLDEVHRLPSEGQEMLFHLMDSGKYRRLGDSLTEWSANVLIVGATTESLESSLLLTFVRRIPMLITLPNLEERPLHEKLELIHLFFQMEQRQINKIIQMDEKVLMQLLNYRYPGNVGQLKTDIQLICARSFLDAKTRKSSELRIKQMFLPPYILKDFQTNPIKPEVKEIMAAYTDKIIYDGSIFHRLVSVTQDKEQMIHESMNIDEIKHYIQTMILKSYENREDMRQNPEEVFKIIKPEIYFSVEEALELIHSRLKTIFTTQTIIAFSMHIQASIERGLDTNIHTKVSENIKDQHPDEYRAAKLVIAYLSEELNHAFAPEEALLATLFLASNQQPTQSHQIGLMVIAHGSGVAKSIVSVANSLLKTDYAQSLDMNLEDSVEAFYQSFEAKAKAMPHEKGLLILADMGSLTGFGQRLSASTDIPTRTIAYLSTPIVLDSLRRVMFGATSLDEVHADVLDMIAEMHADQTTINHQVLASATSPERVLLVTCMTGEGAAVALKHYIQDSLLKTHDPSIQIITTNKDDFDEKQVEGKTLIAVVGAIDLDLQEVPFISTEELLLGSGLAHLNTLIYKRTLPSKQLASHHEKTMLRILKDTLTFLNPEKTLALVLDSFMQIHYQYDIQEFERLNINYALHLPNMIERIMRKEVIAYPDIDQRIQQHPQLYQIIQSSLTNIKDAYMIEIPDTEIGYLMDMFDTH